MRIGLVGVGRWGRHILRDLVALGAEVHAVARSSASVDRARDGLAASIVDTVEALPEVDGFVLATPTTTHAAVIRAVAGRGVPIATEKPLCDDAEEADALVAELGDRLFVLHKWRYHPGIVRLGELARGGTLGRVRAVHCTRIGADNPHDDTTGRWVLAPHDLSIVLQILGEVPPVRAARLEPGDNGLSCLLGDDPWVRLEISCASPVRRREVRVVGDEGWAVLADPYADHVLLQRPGDAEPEKVPIPQRMPLEAELEAFLDHLRGGPPPHSTAAEAAVVVRRIEEMAERAVVARPEVSG